MKRRMGHLCEFFKYRCVLHVGHRTLRDADKCFRSAEAHDYRTRRFGPEVAMAIAKGNHLRWAR